MWSKLLLFSESSAEVALTVCSIVAVHGIGAHPDKTWITNGVNWLQDEAMLPREIPNARILRFGYEILWYGDHAVKTRLQTVAKSLLSYLIRERKARELFHLPWCSCSCLDRAVKEDQLCSSLIVSEDLWLRR